GCRLLRGLQRFWCCTCYLWGLQVHRPWQWFTCRYRGGRRFNGFLSFGNRFSFLRFRLVSHIKAFVVGFDRFLLLASFGLIIRDDRFKPFGNAHPCALTSSSFGI